ncbi:AMP-binding protein, partial [Klebsiella pneumoniae]|nr:AMP-binding protein [Klebsiella pneumoniae]
MANALASLGIQPGERVGTLAWNGYRHMELYFAVSGAGSVLHTLNPRLHVDQLAYIIEHAQDRVIFFDLTFLPLIESVAPRVKSPKIFVAMTDRAHMPRDLDLATTLLCYEDLVDGHSDAFDWPLLDENSASSLCYTSGT